MISTYVIGVTGGIGSGKTTVCELFHERHGTPVIDADVIAREVVEPGQPALAELATELGPEVLDAEGNMDRRRVKELVFADDAKRRVLEGILHPRIRRRMRAALEAVDAPYCLLCIPLLAEGGRHELIDRVLVVDCSEQTQVARVSARDDLTEAQVMAIMRAQASREARLRIADEVIVNDGDRAALVDRVDALHADYVQLARQRHARPSGHEH